MRENKLSNLVQHIKERNILKENFLIKESYTYEDFIKYQDRAFIENIYKALFKREADIESVNHRVELLRDGKKSKMEIISMLRASNEGRKADVLLLGFKKRLLLTLIYRIPLFSLFAKPQRTIDRIENQLYLTSQQKLDKLEERLNSSVTILKQEINQKSNISDSKHLYKELSLEKERIQNYLIKLEEFIDQAKQQLPIENQVNELVEIKESKFNELYKEFEDKFRGDMKVIKERLTIYLPFLSILAIKSDNIEILDVACGRGEWLSLMKEHGYRAKGIDLNQNMVKTSMERGLDVEQAELLSYLKSLPSNNLSLITGFHIVEHLNSFDEVLELLNQAHRVLKSGGFIIFETPNPRNILIGASDFYLDPSHKRPLHPMTMKFFTQKIGFTKVKAFVKVENQLQDIDQIEYRDANDYLYTGQEYAIIGYKL